MPKGILKGMRRGVNGTFAWLLLFSLSFGLPQPFPPASSISSFGAAVICSSSDDGGAAAALAHSCCWWMGCQAMPAVVSAAPAVRVPVLAVLGTVPLADMAAPPPPWRPGSRSRAPPV